MQFLSSPSRGASRTLLGLATSALVGLAACSGGESLSTPVEKPVLPATPVANPQFRQSAFVFDVSTASKTVKVTGPAVTASPTSARKVGSEGVSASLVGGDVIDVVVSNYAASGVGTGGAPPGKVLVTFDVAFTNKLQSVQLIKPTFPIPPSTTAAKFYAFPFEQVVTTTTGGVTGSNNEVIVELPNTGQVTSSTDWNGDGATLTGADWNFFNDVSCTAAGANDCFRYEAYNAPLGGLATSAAQRVGYVIDPTVSNFRSRIIVAADLANAGPAVVTTVSGNVTSPQRGVLSGVTVNISGGFTGLTTATGDFSIASVASGSRTVSLANLPAGCTAPASQSISIASATPITGVNFSVACTASVGTVSGTITKTGVGTQSLAGVQITIAPSAAGAAATTVASTGTASPFAFSSAAVAIGTGTGAGAGTVTLGTLPSGCTATTNTQGYTGLVSGGTVALAAPFAVDCVAPPAFYQLTGTWGAVTGGTVTADFSIDMSTRNDPTNAAPDILAALSFTATYTTGGRVGTPTSCTRLDGGATFDVFTRNFSNPGQILLSIAIASVPAPGVVPIMRCTFPATGTGAVTLAFTNSATVATIYSGTAPAGGTTISVNNFVATNTAILP